MVLVRDSLFLVADTGLYELKGGELRILHHWNSADRVEGPWVDRKGNGLLVNRTTTQELLKMDEKESWSALRWPPPKKGYYSRMDVLHGIHMVEDRAGLWFIGGGEAWRWNSATSTWIPEERPPAGYGAVVGFSVLNEAHYYALDKGFAFIRTPDDQQGTGPLVSIYFKIENRWKQVDNHAPNQLDKVDQMIGLGDRGIILTLDGSLLRLDSGGVNALDTLGICEAVVKTSEGTLLASFINKGIYSLVENTWELRYACPYSESFGRHTACLAEDRGTVAFCVTLDSPFRAPAKDKGEPPSPQLWISRDGALKPVPLRVKY